MMIRHAPDAAVVPGAIAEANRGRRRSAAVSYTRAFAPPRVPFRTIRNVCYSSRFSWGRTRGTSLDLE